MNKRMNKFWYKMSLVFVVTVIIAYVGYKFMTNVNPNTNRHYGQKLDSLNGVYVYYNGNIRHTMGRNTTADGYNLGLKYQCVEFAKRYYYEHYHHKMPDSYGHAKDFYNGELADGSLNRARNLLQFSNPSASVPQAGDLLVFEGNTGNPYGHVAIVASVNVDEVELIQQNPGPFGNSRTKLALLFQNGKYRLKSDRLLGWLRMQEAPK